MKQPNKHVAQKPLPPLPELEPLEGPAPVRERSHSAAKTRNFRALKLCEGDTSSVLKTGLEAIAQPGEGETLWIDLENFEDGDLAILQERFGFHPLAIED